MSREAGHLITARKLYAIDVAFGIVTVVEQIHMDVITCLVIEGINLEVQSLRPLCGTKGQLVRVHRLWIQEG